MDSLTLREAGPDDSEFAYCVKKAAFYRRMGFVRTSSADTHDWMEWTDNNSAQPPR